MVPQREVPVAPFHIGARALEHLRERFGLGLDLLLLHWTQRPKHSIGVKQWGAEALSQRTPWLSCGHRPRRGHTIEIQCGNEMGVHSVGRRRRQVQLPYLLPHIPRDKLDGRPHFGYHALGFRDPIQACLAEVFLLGNGADRVDVLRDIAGNELAVTTHAALQVHKMVGVADGAHALCDLLALPGETLVLVVRCCHILGSLLQAWRHLWRTAWTTLSRLTIGVVEALVHPRER